MIDRQIIKRSNLLISLAGCLLLLISSCTSNYIAVKELNSVNSTDEKFVLDLSKAIEIDTHTGQIVKDSLQRIDEISQFLNKRADYTATVVVYFSNQLRSHIETANLIGYTIKELIVNRNIQDDRVEHDIDYDENHTYVFYSKHQKILIYFSK